MKLLDSTQTVENPVSGERFEFREDSDVLRFDYYVEPGGFQAGRIPHAHPRQTEQFDVRSGRLTVRMGGNEWTATPGTKFAIPTKTAHSIRNEGDETVHARVEIQPALETRTFLETMAGLAREGKTNRWGMPGPLQTAVLADHYREEMYFPGVPVTLQRALAAAVAQAGRSLGYRASYPRFSERSA